MTTCACKPGTAENGWHEIRCDECLRAEIDDWGRVTAWIRGNQLARRANDNQETE